ncbi:hypothetical protein DMW99_29980 [Pseudomonas chlororaphis]|nr:hypothetical protein C1Y36_16165 [Pseudomonas sp. FW306-2-2C-D06C]PYC29993.1 hypothetical protein DMW99_29980 [Pseudomonas chlororaphis]
MLAMIVNDDAYNLAPRIVLRSIASNRASTGCSYRRMAVVNEGGNRCRLLMAIKVMPGAASQTAQNPNGDHPHAPFPGPDAP